MSVKKGISDSTPGKVQVYDPNRIIYRSRVTQTYDDNESDDPEEEMELLAKA